MIGLALLLTISHLAAASLALAFGRIQGAEEVRNSCAFDDEVTQIQCRACRGNVATCKCAKGWA